MSRQICVFTRHICTNRTKITVDPTQTGICEAYDIRKICRTSSPQTFLFSLKMFLPSIFASTGHFPPILLSVCQCELPTMWNKKAEPVSFICHIFCHWSYSGQYSSFNATDEPHPSDVGGLTWPITKCRWLSAVAKGRYLSNLTRTVKIAPCRYQLCRSHIAALATAVCVVCNVTTQVFTVNAIKRYLSYVI